MSGLSSYANIFFYLQVEKTPAVIKKGLKKEEAEALKAKLESGKR